MKRVCYFNVGYSCNNACVYCFSYSTGLQRKDLSFDDFKEVLSIFKPTENDKVVINGGEPSIHPYFYDMLDYIDQEYNTNIVVYSNGVRVDVRKISHVKNIQFVIPIHGDAEIHDAITRQKGSFESTLKTLRSFQAESIGFSIKFIANKNMIDSGFDISSFLKKNHLAPSSTYIARLNATKKSRENNVQYPTLRELKNFVFFSHESLYVNNKIVYLDLPFCLLPDLTIKNPMPEIPPFFFTDYKKKLDDCLYYKQLMLRKDKCENCYRRDLCSVMQKSYLTLIYDKEWYLDLE